MSAESATALEFPKLLADAMPRTQSGTVVMAITRELHGMGEGGHVQYAAQPVLVATPDCEPAYVAHALYQAVADVLANIPPCPCAECPGLTR